jgi:hypothetical protein
MPYEDDLHSHLSSFDTAPFLFVGSGLSRRYLGSEDWDGLLEIFATPIVDYSYARFRSDSNKNPARTASAIADRFKDVWWESPDYAESRDLFPAPETSESPLKIEISRHLDTALSNIPASGLEYEELETLRSAAAIEGVITTNYDRFLETIFPEYAVYAGQDQLLFNASYGVGEIFKIHGSTDAPETLVLTEKDYERFNERNQYLAAKLLTIFVEHPILFLGYSLSDPNIQEILQNIGAILTTENLGKLQNRLIFIQWTNEPIESVLTPTFHGVNGQPIPIISIQVNDFRETFAALARLRARLPAPVLRRVKEQVYDLVATSKSKGTLLVRDIDDEVNPDQVEIVIGLGIRQQLALEGLVGWDRTHVTLEVLQQVLDGNKKALETVARDLLPQHLNGGTNTPIYYYLDGAEQLAPNRRPVMPSDLHERVLARDSRSPGAFREPVAIPRKYYEMAARYASFDELALAEEGHTVFLVLQLIDLAKVDPAALREYLLSNVELTEEGKPTTNWAKAVCIYDALAFGPLGSVDVTD